MKKTVVILILLIFLFAMPVSAAEDFYGQQLENSGFSGVEDALPEEVREYFEQNGIDAENPDWIENLSTANVFKTVLNFIKSGAKQPFRSFAEILCIIIAAAAVSAFCTEGGGTASALNYIFSVIICLTVLRHIAETLLSSASAIKGTGTFMLSFLPVFGGILLLGGGTATSASGTALLLGAAELIVGAAAFLIVPLMSAYLGVGVASGVSPLIKNTALHETVKKAAMWILGFVFTAFTGLLSMQTAISAAADTFGTKTLKFMVNSCVPVAGTALSEAVTTVSAAVTLLKSSIGIYAVLAIALILLPVIIELGLWRLVLMLSGTVSGMFALPRAPTILKAVDSCLSVLIGITLFVGAVFIISLAILIKSGVKA